MGAKKKIAGERLESGQFNENTSEHLHRYSMAINYCSNKRVLDIACGDGYGSNLLAKSAKSVVGVDIDNDTIILANKKYTAANLEYKTGSASAIPFPDDSFEVLISFETLEHHDKHIEMISEIKRVLVPGGLCIISTPDKLVYSDKKNYQNPFHVKELYKEEFLTLMKNYFKNVSLYKQQFLSGSLIVPDKVTSSVLGTYKGDFESVQSGNDVEAEYLIAFASDIDLPVAEASFFIDDDFAGNKIKQFKKSSLRYKIGNILLKPVKFIRGNKAKS